MKLKYHIPTSLDHITIKIIAYMFFIGLIITYLVGAASAVTYINNSNQYLIKNPDFENGTYSESWNFNPTSGTFYITSGSAIQNGSKASAVYVTTGVPVGTLAFINQTVNFSKIINISFWYKCSHVDCTTNALIVSFNNVSMLTVPPPSSYTLYSITNNQTGIGTLSFKFINPYNGAWGESQVYALDNITGYAFTPADLAITSFNNSFTNDTTLNFSIPSSQTVRFNLTGDNVDKTSWFVNGVNQSQNFDNLTYPFTGVGTYTIEGRLTNTTQGNLSKTWVVTYPFELLTPVNGSTLINDYPPMTKSIDFSWSDNPDVPYYHIQVSKTNSFSQLVVDKYTSSPSITESLEGGYTYWWKIRSYNQTTLTYSDYSLVSNFTILNTQALSGSAIQGVVYYLTGSTQNPLSGATVYIYNNTWSSTQTVGSNGYYLFNGLPNGSVYYLKAIKSNYQTSEIETVNVSGITTRNILMKPAEPTYFEPEKMYVNFLIHYKTCTEVFGTCPISNANVSIYEYGGAVAEASGVTDSNGFIRFYLYKTKLYTITVINTTAGINYNQNVFITSTDIEITIGDISKVYPNTSIINPNASLYNQTWDNRSALLNFTSANLTSSIGLGVMGQGITVGILNWVVVGAGGLLASIFVSAILVFLGVLSLTTVAFFIITGISLWYLTKG